MPKYYVDFSKYGIIEIDADSEEEAIKKAMEQALTSGVDSEGKWEFETVFSEDLFNNRKDLFNLFK